MNSQDISAIPHQPQHRIDLEALLAQHPELQIEQDEYNINVTANYGTLLTPSEVLERYIRHDGAQRPAHLYLHVPICSYICHFCNYVKRLLPNGEGRDSALDYWTDTLINESERYLDRISWLPKARIESFYIGGGTAALLEERHLNRLIGHIKYNYNFSDDCELTLEGNPDNFSKVKIRAAMSLGFNRFSLGVQSFQDEVNQFTAREHDSKASLKAIHNLAESNCPFNVDMMFGLPYQTPESFRKDIQTLVDLRVPTITIYRLRNADRERMGIGNRAVWNIPKISQRIRKQGLFPAISQTYNMRTEAVEALLNHDYYPSPCGWWNAAGAYPDGNIPRVSRNKWQRYDTMIAYGPGAYGWLTGENSTIIQTHNEPDISAYSNHMETSKIPPLAFGRLLQGNQAIGSAIGFAFKANQPIRIDSFRRQFGVDILKDSPCKEVINELLIKGFLSYCNGGDALRPTLEAEALHEEIISVYLHGRIGSYSARVCQKMV